MVMSRFHVWPDRWDLKTDDIEDLALEVEVRDELTAAKFGLEVLWSDEMDIGERANVVVCVRPFGGEIVKFKCVVELELMVTKCERMSCNKA
jgi:hypothetical protein